MRSCRTGQIGVSESQRGIAARMTDSGIQGVAVQVHSRFIRLAGASQSMHRPTLAAVCKAVGRRADRVPIGAPICSRWPTGAGVKSFVPLEGRRF